MKSNSALTIVTLLMATLFFTQVNAQKPQNWTSNQLIEPAELAATLKTNKNLPIILSVGPGAVIPHSIAIGMVNNAEGIDKLKTELAKFPKDSKVVVYCGCCPFEHCPNVRPAIETLKNLQFKNYQLLDLSHNIKQDWIDEGYPVIKE